MKSAILSFNCCGKVGIFVLMLGVLLPCVSGCGQALGVLCRAWYGDNVDPPCMEMEGKVAVVCRPRASTSYQYGDVSNELAKAVNTRVALGIKDFRKKKKRESIEMIPHEEVEKYCDGMEAESDFIEIGKAVGADQVIAIDLLGFNHIAGTNVWQGRADMNVQLIDVKTGQIIYQPESLPEYVYPRNYVVPSTDQNEWNFQREYILRLGRYISRQFVPHDRFDIDL
ncbi:MAG: hypothetical protein Q4C70_13010 [Planctomycetia bacterium]|nr:hypothetical protein [Planctomycetia bacterium]